MSVLVTENIVPLLVRECCTVDEPAGATDRTKSRSWLSQE
jgi:hypothetical protein